MKAHCRCKGCGRRKKLKQNPEWYIRQPKCSKCGSRSWRWDRYRQLIEVPMMRKGLARYRKCYCDGYHFTHRMGYGECKFLLSGEYKAPAN